MKRLRVALWVMAAIAFVGFLDASFLAINHMRGILVPCSLVQGCEVVTTSAYSEIFGIPVALLGAGYYLLVLCLTVASLQTESQQLVTWLRRLTLVGLVASAYFVSLQLIVIDAICVYCMLSAATSTALFFIALVYLKKKIMLITHYEFKAH